jgi:heterodisulfide reductase subunit A
MMKTGAISFMGRGGARKVGTPYDEYSDVCITCGACEKICPTGAITAKMSSGNDPVPFGKKFEENLISRSNIDIPFPSAVPLIPSIDPDNCIRFKISDDACGMCQSACPADAIDFNQTVIENNVEVGSIVAAPGFEAFNPSGVGAYAYDTQPNVMTSMEFERMLSAGGPFAGHVHRLSDGKEPKKIAWLQCVGSRDMSEVAKAYCSSVCCMYALKQAMIAKEHVGEGLDTSIFFIDMRTFGTDFEKYLERAKEQGIRLIRSRVRTVTPVGNNGDLNIRYLAETGEIIEEDFDMVILSVGLVISKGTVELAHKLGLSLDHHDLMEASCFEPVSSTRPGIYACGVFTNPKDIPRTVMEASAAASASTVALAQSRGTLLKKKEFPPEKDVSSEPARVGVFVCNCGINIGGVADVPAIVEHAKSLPGVEYAQDNLFSCSQDSLNQMAEMINEHNLNRVVVASCSPSTHEFIFQEMLRNAGLNKYLFEMVNIRNQCTWCHQKEPEMATEKCQDLVNMAVAKARLIEPLEYISVEVNRQAIVIGGGVTGIISALGLANQGYIVHLVEMTGQLGGNALRLHTTWKGEKVRPYVDDLVEKVKNNDKINIYLESTVEEVSGFVGNFKSKLSTGHEIDHGVVVLATGGEPYQPEGQYLYGENPNVLLSLDLDSEIVSESERIKSAQTAAFIQCVGSRIPERMYCSKVCCSHSVENAIKLKELNPDMDVYIIYRDMRTYGKKEDLFKKAREKGVSFIRYNLEDLPKVEDAGGKIRITVKDQVLQGPVEIVADILTLASAIVPHDNTPLAQLYKVALNAEGFFSQAHVKMRPVDCATYGIFLAGMCQYPKPFDECIAQGLASSSRASTILSKDKLQLESIISHPVEANCDGCAFCVEPCPFNAITLLEYMKKGDVKKTVEVNEVLCQGCGSCMATCPKQGINVAGFSLDQLGAQVEAALGLV